jgi:hypothetical protein
MHLLSMFLAGIGVVNALENGLARTPQLGWVSLFLVFPELSSSRLLMLSEYLELVRLQYE